MKITFQLTQDDLVEFNLYHSAHSPLHIKTLRRQRVLVPIIYLVISVFGAMRVDLVFAGIFAALSILWFLLFPKWTKKRYRKHYIKHIEENFSSIDKEPVTIELKDDGIHSTSHMGHSVFKYSVVEKIVENDDVTYIYIGKGMALVLPHDRVPDNERAALREGIEKHEKTNSNDVLNTEP